MTKEKIMLKDGELLVLNTVIKKLKRLILKTKTVSGNLEN